MNRHRTGRGGLLLAALALGLAWPGAALADSVAPANAEVPRANLHGEAASPDVRDVANWVIAAGDNQALPFVIVDKVAARVFLFDSHGDLRGAAAALLGLARGDGSVPGIGQRRLATITPAERTTPAGRFKAALGRDFEQDILWIDYDAALSLHRVIVGNRKDRRAERLASASPLDNRISYGCINVPAAFYDDIVVPAFSGTVGIVYILPETRPLRDLFPVPAWQASSGPDGQRPVARPH